MGLSYTGPRGARRKEPDHETELFFGRGGGSAEGLKGNNECNPRCPSKEGTEGKIHPRETLQEGRTRRRDIFEIRFLLLGEKELREVWGGKGDIPGKVIWHQRYEGLRIKGRVGNGSFGGGGVWHRADEQKGSYWRLVSSVTGKRGVHGRVPCKKS